MNSFRHTEKRNCMKTGACWILGVGALGLALAAPVQAAPNFRDGAFIVAERDSGNETRQDRRDSRKDARPAPKRETEREEAKSYGYGYERRQQQQSEEDRRPRDRR